MREKVSLNGGVRTSRSSAVSTILEHLESWSEDLCSREEFCCEDLSQARPTLIDLVLALTRIPVLRGTLVACRSSAQREREHVHTASEREGGGARPSAMRTCVRTSAVRTSHALAEVSLGVASPSDPCATALSPASAFHHLAACLRLALPRCIQDHREARDQSKNKHR